MEIVDTLGAGQWKDYAGTHGDPKSGTYYFPLDGDVYLLCYSVSDPTSFEIAQDRLYTELTRHCTGVPFLVVATKADLRTDPETIERLADTKPVSLQQGEEMASKIGAVKFLECSCATTST